MAQFSSHLERFWDLEVAIFSLDLLYFSLGEWPTTQLRLVVVVCPQEQGIEVKRALIGA